MIIEDKKLPNGWRLVKLGDVSNRIHYGFTASADFSRTETRLLRITDIQDGLVKWNKVPGCKITPDEEADNLLIGQVNIVPKLADRTTFECHIIRAHVNKSIVNPYYILGLYRSYYGKKFILQRSNTATMTTISQEALQELPCPIPPLPLQEKFAQIVQKFERLRTQQREAERQAEHLFQTILHRAFRGELTSSDINEEPASDILEPNPPKPTKPETSAKVGNPSTHDTAKNPDSNAKQQYTEAIQLKLPGFE